jgi:hypothetical protein
VCVRFRRNDRVRYYYPDALVACGGLDPNSIWIDAPLVVVEVTSNRTECFDRREKLETCGTCRKPVDQDILAGREVGDADTSSRPDHFSCVGLCQVTKADATGLPCRAALIQGRRCREPARFADLGAKLSLAPGG